MNYILKLNMCKSKVIFTAKWKRRHPHEGAVVVSWRRRATNSRSVWEAPLSQWYLNENVNEGLEEGSSASPLTSCLPRMHLVISEPDWVGLASPEPTWFFLNLALCSANFPRFCVSFMAPSLSFNIPWTLSSKPSASHCFADCPLCQVICLGPCWCVHVFYTLDWVSCWSDHPLWTEMILSGSHENSGESWNRIIKSEYLSTDSSISIFSLPRWF